MTDSVWVVSMNVLGVLQHAKDVLIVVVLHVLVVPAGPVIKLHADVVIRVQVTVVVIALVQPMQ